MIDEFFLEANNSHAREKIINHYLWFELEKAAALSNYELQIYKPETDHVGIDLLFDDMTTIKGFQIKTVISTAKTSKWKIHKRLISPQMQNINNFGFQMGGGNGLEGGVILLNIICNTEKTDFTIDFYYFDVYILKMFANNIISKKGCKCNKLALNVYKEFAYSNDDCLDIPKSLFVKVKNASSLLAIAGLHSNDSTHGSGYRYNLKELKMWVKKEEINTSDITPNNIFEVFQELIDDKKVKFSF